MRHVSPYIWLFSRMWKKWSRRCAYLLKFMQNIYLDYIISVCILCGYQFGSFNYQMCVCPRFDERDTCLKALSIIRMVSSVDIVIRDSAICGWFFTFCICRAISESDHIWEHIYIIIICDKIIRLFQKYILSHTILWGIWNRLVVMSGHSISIVGNGWSPGMPPTILLSEAFLLFSFFVNIKECLQKPKVLAIFSPK